MGPGTNTAAAHGNSEYIVYVCGKEGFVSQPFWDSAVIQYMAEHPEVGLAGTQCYSPTYLYGRDYPEGIPEWPNFRNQSFALDNPDRPFAHVQGGFFAMRRAMLNEIGGFSDAVPHSYTDVEFSYYVESCGWQLGEMPHLLALFNKTRPDIVSRMDEDVYATHPPMLEQREWLDAIATRAAYACNVCGNLDDERFDVCGSCGALPADRSLYRRLAESSLTFRRLPAIAIGVGKPLEAFWKKSFQGAYWTHDDLAVRFDFGDGRMKLAVCRDVSLINETDRSDVLAEIRRTLDPVDGELWIQTQYRIAANDSELPQLADLRAWLADAGFEVQSRTRYSSAVIAFDSNAILHCKVRN